MYETIVERVKTRLRQFHIKGDGNNSTKVFDNLEDNPVIEECVKSNIEWLKSKFNKKFSDDELDLFHITYESILCELTLYDVCIEGAEYQVTHNENGVNRQWRSKDDIFNGYGYFSYVKFL